jgi:hypothetical protein
LEFGRNSGIFSLNLYQVGLWTDGLVMANPPKSVSYLKKLVSAARAIVTYQVGLPVGCIRIRRALFWLRPHKVLSYPVFDKYLQALSGLPISSERLMWNREVLREADKKLEAVSRRFRDEIFEACYEIIDLSGEQSGGSASTRLEPMSK